MSASGASNKRNVFLLTLSLCYEILVIVISKTNIKRIRHHDYRYTIFR